MSLSFGFNSSLLIVSVVQMLYKVIWFSSKIKNRRRWWNVETASFTEKEIETKTEKGWSSCKESMFNLCICYWICFGHWLMMSWIFPGGWREKWGNKYCWGIQNWQETTYQTSWFGPSWGEIIAGKFWILTILFLSNTMLHYESSWDHWKNLTLWALNG